MSTPWIVAFAVLWALALATAVTVIGLLRRVVGVLEVAEHRLDLAAAGRDVGGLDPGMVVSSFVVTNESNETIDSADLFRTRSMVLFSSAQCEPCKEIARELRDAGDLMPGVDLYVVFDESARGAVSGHPGTVLYQSDQRASRAFDNRAAPQAFVVDAGGRIRNKYVPASADDLHRLVRDQKGGDWKAEIALPALETL